MNVLLAGETFSAITSVAAGADVVTSSTWSNGATAFIAALSGAGMTVTQIGGERCGSEFPTELDALQRHAVVVLSDVSALSLLVTPAARAGRTGVNRLELLKTYVEQGGGLLMAGGYMSFQGMFGNAHFHDTAVEDILPVRCLAWADGLEIPEGTEPCIRLPGHPVVAGLDQSWPPVLGLNKVDFRWDASSQLIATAPCRGHDLPLLAVRDAGLGRSAAWMTDIGPREFHVGMIGGMHAIEVAELGGPEVLSFVERPEPTPGPGEVLIKAEAIGVNFIDTYFRSGLYQREVPYIPGTEVCGTITAVGDDVAALAVGDRVVTAAADATYSEYCVAPADYVAYVPEGVDPEVAAAAEALLREARADVGESAEPI